MTTHRPTDVDVHRRDAVVGLSALAIAADVVGACTNSSEVDALDGGVTSEAGACALFPEQTAGPFYFDPELVRDDITEGRPGVPLRLRVRVLQASDCTPIVGAAVDVWHADALGWYSGYPGQGDDGDQDTSGQTFLRGIQPTDAEGVAEFRRIYPGWYPGRTTHIHVKIHLDDETIATAQLYFADDVSTAVYDQVPYDGARAEAGGQRERRHIRRRRRRERRARARAGSRGIPRDDRHGRDLTAGS